MDDDLEYQRYDSFDKEALKKKQKEFRRKAYLAAKARKKEQAAAERSKLSKDCEADLEMKEKAKQARRKEYERQKQLLQESKKKERQKEKLEQENEAKQLREQKRFDLLNLTLMKGSEVPSPAKPKSFGGKPNLRVVKD